MSAAFLKKRNLYRSREGMIFGVCKGLAEYTDLPLCGLRWAMVFILVFTGIFPIVLVYIVAALLMKPEPVVKPESDEDWEFYNSFANSRNMALNRLKKKFEQLEKRARRMENTVTAKEFDWEQRFRSGT